MTVRPEQLCDLRDGSLRIIAIDWASGLLRLEVVLARHLTRTAILHVHGLSGLALPRKLRWSESDAIYDLRLKGHELELEMHSGDTIRVEAEDFRLELRETGEPIGISGI